MSRAVNNSLKFHSVAANATTFELDLLHRLGISHIAKCIDH